MVSLRLSLQIPLGDKAWSCSSTRVAVRTALASTAGGDSARGPGRMMVVLCGRVVVVAARSWLKSSREKTFKERGEAFAGSSALATGCGY